MIIIAYTLFFSWLVLYTLYLKLQNEIPDSHYNFIESEMHQLTDAIYDYQKDNKKLPEKLSVLVDKYIPILPISKCHYKIISDTEYELYHYRIIKYSSYDNNFKDYDLENIKNIK
jgi:hypothetical protein